MLLVPWLVGLLLAHRADVVDAGRVLLGPAWLVGYLAFNAATLMTKAAPVRRAGYRRPLVSHGVAAVALGLATVILGGLEILGWAIPGAVLVGVALLLTRLKRERSVVTGMVSVIAGTGVGVVTRFWSPADLVDATSTELAVLGLTVAYFAGTVLTVKTMIRERGHRGWIAASVGYHVVVLAVAATAVVWGWVGWPWAVLAGLLLVRAGAEPLLGTRMTVLQIGLVEVVLSVLVLLAALFG